MESKAKAAAQRVRAAAWRPPRQLSPVTDDPDEAREWLDAFSYSGVEGLVTGLKPAGSQHSWPDEIGAGHWGRGAQKIPVVKVRPVPQVASTSHHGWPHLRRIMVASCQATCRLTCRFGGRARQDSNLRPTD